MDVIGEIQRGCSGWHFDNVATWTHRVNAVFEDVTAQLVEQITVGIRGIEEVAQQPYLAVETRFVDAAVLVTPVCGDSEFCMSMHLLCADLDFDDSSFRPDQRRVKRLVIVALGVRNVVVELTR